ncbi:hypothetical protein BDV93DRAFT_535091 [Ceratobasidium sp. AG-I]|nr:hypothetical protein BDV93DRAFT_535091 [Ceratobasidium sp. AG-I]
MTFRTSVRQPSASTVLVSEQRQRESITSVNPTTPRRLIKVSPLIRSLYGHLDHIHSYHSLQNTNVIELYSHIEKSDTQLTYYNSGIGTYAKPSWKSMAYLKQVVSSRIDLAIAWNLDRVIIGAYRWLSDNYRPGDQIFLFGFSRGAYQVRAIAGMIATVHIKIDTFRKTFSRNLVEVHFLGAWDTVSSIGLRRGSLLPLTNRHEHIKYFRHALALDERRVKFLPEYVDYDGEGDTDKEHVKEVWFAGTHSDM